MYTKGGCPTETRTGGLITWTYHVGTGVFHSFCRQSCFSDSLFSFCASLVSLFICRFLSGWMIEGREEVYVQNLTHGQCYRYFFYLPHCLGNLILLASSSLSRQFSFFLSVFLVLFVSAVCFHFRQSYEESSLCMRL